MTAQCHFPELPEADLNPRPRGPKPDALPTPQKFYFKRTAQKENTNKKHSYLVGLGLLTFNMQRRHKSPGTSLLKVNFQFSEVLQRKLSSRQHCAYNPRWQHHFTVPVREWSLVTSHIYVVVFTFSRQCSQHCLIHFN